MSNNQEAAASGVQQPHTAEHRLYERSAYSAWHRLAFHDGQTRPVDADFSEFETYDFSPDGFSFWATEAPASKFVVVELGSSTRRIYAKAQVKHVTNQDRHGVPAVLVGCKFRGRF